MSVNNIKNSKKNSIVFCSLGENCFPRTILTISGIKPRKEDGEKSCPFDLCVTPSSQLIKILANDFNNFVESIKFDDTRKQYFSEYYYIYFNHDTDCENSPSGLNKIKIRYTNRILNFKELLSSDKYIFFVLFKTQCVGDIRKAFDILHKTHKNSSLIYIDCENKIKFYHFFGKKIHIVKEKHTFKKIDDWWLPENKPKLYNLMLPIVLKINKIVTKYKFNANFNEKSIIDKCGEWWNL